MKQVKIHVYGWGGEHTIGTLTNEQANYWKDQDEETLINHISGDDDEEYDEPIYEWYDVDNVDHTSGCLIDDFSIEIYFGNDEKRIFEGQEGFNVESNGGIGYPDMEKNTPHLICYAEDKGNLLNFEFEVEDDAEFNQEDFTIIEREVIGSDFIVDMKYKGKLLGNLGADSIGKGFSAEIIYPDDEN